MRHVEVGQHHCDRVVCSDDRESLLRVVAAAAVETGPSECSLENRQRRQIIIEEKDCLFHVAVCGSRCSNAQYNNDSLVRLPGTVPSLAFARAAVTVTGLTKPLTSPYSVGPVPHEEGRVRTCIRDERRRYHLRGYGIGS